MHTTAELYNNTINRLTWPVCRFKNVVRQATTLTLNMKAYPLRMCATFYRLKTEKPIGTRTVVSDVNNMQLTM
jgi:hypothetical protein